MKMRVVVTVDVDVPWNHSDEDAVNGTTEAMEYAAYEAAREALNDNSADWYAERVTVNDAFRG